MLRLSNVVLSGVVWNPVVVRGWFSTAEPPAPDNIQSFIDTVGFMSTTWNGSDADTGVVQYNMQYRLRGRDDDVNGVTVPMGVTGSNVTNLQPMVMYEVSSACMHNHASW